MMIIRYSATNGTSGAMVVDATLDQVQSKTVEVTQYPVEDGSVISDHAILRPDTYQLTGVITNTPLVPPDGMASMAGRAEEARLLLESLIEARQPVTLSTEIREYPMMVLSNLSFPRDATTGDATKFSCTATQITKVRSETVPIPRSTKPGISHGGRQPTQKAPEPVKKRVSVLKTIVDTIRGK